MASRIKDASHIKDNVGLAPPDQPAATAYERDFYAWLMEQARHVRDGHWNAVDRENATARSRGRQPQPKASHRRSHRARLSQGTGRSREGTRTRRGRVSRVVP